MKLMDVSSLAGMAMLQVYLSEVSDQTLERDEKKLDSPENGETVLGVLQSRDAKLLYSVRKVLTGKAMEMMGKAKTAGSDDEERAVENEAKQLAALAEIASSLFWFSIKDEDPKYLESEGIGIRSNWKIVALQNDRPGRSISDLLEGLGGLGR